MTHAFPPTHAPFVKCIHCHGTLDRLIGNLSGFLYRRQLDSNWTIDFVSDGCRDITGYDPHRFIANASIAFGDLIAGTDRKRVDERVEFAIRHRRRATVEYLIRTAHGAWVQVEDRFTPVVSAAGKVVAIEGIIDRSRATSAPTWTRPQHAPTVRRSAVCHSPSLN
jgi:PAS domain-containing protein